MIRGYSDHAANERTFLAWVRTGIAVIAFAFVVEKFNLFIRTLAEAGPPDERQLLQRLSAPLGRYDVLVLILIGLALIVLAAVRFIRIAHLLDDQENHPAGGARAELLLSAGLALIVAGLSAYLVLT